MDAKRQWFKSRVGLNLSEIHRNDSLCNYTVLSDCPEVFVVENIVTDIRFKNNKYVVGAPHVAFYAGAALVVNGNRIGVISVCDVVPREFDSRQRAKLARIGKLLTNVLVRRRNDMMNRTNLGAGSALSARSQGSSNGLQRNGSTGTGSVRLNGYFGSSPMDSHLPLYPSAGMQPTLNPGTVTGAGAPSAKHPTGSNNNSINFSLQRLLGRSLRQDSGSSRRNSAGNGPGPAPAAVAIAAGVSANSSAQNSQKSVIGVMPVIPGVPHYSIKQGSQQPLLTTNDSNKTVPDAEDQQDGSKPNNQVGSHKNDMMLTNFDEDEL
jgi:hypothetical protein